MNRDQLIRVLVNDFIGMYPEASYGEILETRMRLDGLDLDDLKLLANQIKPKVEETVYGN